MKKILSFFTALCFSILFAHPQMNTSVDISDSIYSVLEIARLRGLCSSLPGVKPYSEQRILIAIDEILENESKLLPTEKEVLYGFKETHTRKEGLDLWNARYRLENDAENFPLSLQIQASLETSASSGFYTKSAFNQWGFDIMPSISLSGDIGNNVSYATSVLFDLTRMPLHKMGDYFIGYSWYESDVEGFFNGTGNGDDLAKRTINKFLNTSYLPYSYQKKWGGQMYLLSNMSASGLEGWAQSLGMSGDITGEIRGSFLNNKISVSAGRGYREWAAMDDGSSLVLNKKARPFMAAEFTVELFPFLKFSGLTGILEYPNQDYINENSYASDHKNRTDDSYFFQNAFSINMIELDFKYFHFDAGTSVVWPKRFELGYIFPLTLFLEYQNHVGDYDNLALFGNVKFQKPGLGSLWASLYLDEINGLNNNPITSARAMFAGQIGTKVVIPKLPFATVSVRYTKIEPYCYTHHSINYTPWYAHYISENYTNNGEALGYYLPPNSDELLLRFNVRPKASMLTSLQYQFIRHGADYGSQQVPGSSLYSEMSPYNRDSLKKYFLRDGAYQWMHIVSIGASYDFKKTKIPFQLFGNAGFLYSYFTVIDDVVYDKRGADRNTPFHSVDTSEYPVQTGVVLTLGIKIWP
ncbi:hypothetical protein [Treponema brennaborense]|uniref:Capsule assembly protein Wzi n=1 Tax=Treponema brennaborense (strain DSM 12168 / CIP 105900 / DD5/3) TaxID=906968 RepID=F4LMI5_TREBD|nr:hypothetical protein [Treponema brennaborense]AEE15747.1 hypothetical protein Trebr_0299 [Treponema brennaborense DSM 12168]